MAAACCSNRKNCGSGEEHYHETAILCISLKHLPAYLETLDESRLQSYVATLHRMTFGSAGFYGVIWRRRQFGLAVYFSAHTRGLCATRRQLCLAVIALLRY